MNKTHTKPVIKTIALSLALVLLASTLLLIPAEAADTSSMGALIDYFKANTSSTFTLTTESRFYIVVDSATASPPDELVQTIVLAQRQFATDGLPSTTPMEIVKGTLAQAQSGDIVVVLDANAALTNASGYLADGYYLDVTDCAVVTARTVRGMLYGLNMLQKHFRNANKVTNIQGFTAADAPDTAERTLSLDCGRKYYTKEWICNMIREMSWMGYNTIQLHFSEDAGFRMDFWDPEYYVTGSYEPKNDFSWLCGSEHAYHIQYFEDNCNLATTALPTDVDKDRYLTTAEIIEILNTAKEYHIDVIPSFDSPNHLDYLTWKYEQHYLKNTSYSFYSTYYEQTFNAKDINGIINYTNVSGQTYINDRIQRPKPYFKAVNVNESSNKQARAFILELYIDIANFFKTYANSTDFSICGDEVVLSQSGVTFLFKYEHFVSYINDLNTLLRSDKCGNYTVRMYNDFMGTDLSLFDSTIEIMYWQSPYDPTTGSTGSGSLQVPAFTSNGRILYNCIQTHTYYAQPYSSLTEYHPDGRCPLNTNWTMSRGTEDLIYTEWAPNDFAEKLANYQEGGTAGMIVPDANWGGAYFLIWSDNPTLSTEQEIWNGFTGCDSNSSASVTTPHLFISLLDRMWSNTTKMWNSDIDSSLSFSNFKTLRDSMGDFPGLVDSTGSYAKAANLVAGNLADKTELANAVKNKVVNTNNLYTTSSYTSYETAYNAAVAVNEDAYAFQSEVDDTLAALNTAQAALALKTFTVTVNHYAQNTTTAVKPSETLTTTTTSNHYELEVTNLSNYVVASVSGSSYTSTSSGVTLYGDATANTTITVYYKEIVDTTALNALIATGDSLSSTYYTDDSWTAYSTALSNAKTVAANESATQAQVDAAADALQAAFDALVTTGDPKVTPLSVELLSTTVPMGKQVGLRIISDPSVETLSITCNGVEEKQIFCSSQVQKLADDDIVRIWLVFIDADTAGTFTYTINGTVNVTVTVV